MVYSSFTVGSTVYIRSCRCPNLAYQSIYRDELTLAFIPKSWEQYLHASGSTFLSALVLIELLSLASPLRLSFIGAMDHWAHLGGYVTGAVVGTVWKENRARRHETK